MRPRQNITCLVTSGFLFLVPACMYAAGTNTLHLGVRKNASGYKSLACRARWGVLKNHSGARSDQCMHITLLYFFFVSFLLTIHRLYFPRLVVVVGLHRPRKDGGRCAYLWLMAPKESVDDLSARYPVCVPVCAPGILEPSVCLVEQKNNPSPSPCAGQCKNIHTRTWASTHTATQ